ncbi:hypothetical protein GQ53DRAFT_721621 [Thozetella sp. PMI_491]|nr:hypothetical protein GQ53DRAFT_721621 [Thozetella sp. PMI_491]
MEDDIAIVGVSFKLPQGAENESNLWDMLEHRRNAMTEWPKSRISLDSFYDADPSSHNRLHGRGAHFLESDPAAFDAPFFSITAKEAAAMDPQHRMALEASYRAFENGKLSLTESLRGSQTGVFAASMSDDYSRMNAKDIEGVTNLSIAGTALSLLPNRISWYFDLQGPSLHIDTACSGSLVALHMACQSLRTGDATMALVAGANLMLGPEGSLMLSNGNYLSPDSVCYSFDHRANGYARGEGIVAIIIKPVRDAVRDGDMIRAVIRATASNQDGRTPILTQPSADAQEKLIRRAYQKAGLDFGPTRFFEAHGTGTAVGDPAEMKAIGRVFRRYRSEKEPLYVGSLKSNIGHLEGSAGLASVVKAILILERGRIPPNALFERMNPNIDADFYHIEVPTKSIPWPAEGLRRISINSFGFGGTNAHAIIDDAFNYLHGHNIKGNHCTSPSPVAPSMANVHGNGAYTESGNGVCNGDADGMPKPEPSPRLLVWTAADESTLKSTIEAYQTYWQDHVFKTGDVKLDQLAYTLAARRSTLLWRTFSVVGQDSELRSARFTRASADTTLLFVFTGQGAQYEKMGLELIKYPIFEATLRKIDAIFRSLGCAWTIFDELGQSSNIDLPEYSQPLCTALQIALVELLKSFNVIPSAVIGHSSGEIAAAYTSGALSLPSACKVAYFRGLVTGKLKRASVSSPDAMLSANLSKHAIADYLSRIDPKLTRQVCVACINSPINCTLSGPETAIDIVKQQLDKDEIFAHKLKTGVAYHSPTMMAVAAEYAELMGSLEAGDSTEYLGIPMVSSVSAKPILSTALLSTAQYWVDNLVSSVRFSEALIALTQGPLNITYAPISHIVEVGPHPALRRPIQDTLNQGKSRKRQMRYTNVLHRSRPAHQATLEFLGQLFCDGYPVSLTAANRQSSVSNQTAFLVDSPEYPFNHSRTYWSEARLSRDFRLRRSAPGDSLGARCHDWNPLAPKWRRFISAESTPWTKDHVMGTVLYPGAGMIVMAIEAVQQICAEDRTVAGYTIKEARFLSPIIIGKKSEESTETIVELRRIQNPYEKESRWSEVKIMTQIKDRWTECFRATIQTQYEDDGATTQVDAGRERQCWNTAVIDHLKHATDSCTKRVDSQAFYRYCHNSGLQYGETFRLVRNISWDGARLAVAQIDLVPSEHQTSSLVHPAVLDNTLQVILAQVSNGLSEQCSAYVPYRLSNTWISASGWKPHQQSCLHIAAERVANPNVQEITATVHVLGNDGTPLCVFESVTMSQVAGKQEDDSIGRSKLLYGIEWKPQLSLMSREQLRHACNEDAFTQDETAMATFRTALEPVLLKILNKVSKELTDADLHRLKPSMQSYVRWMRHHLENFSTPKKEEESTDEDLQRLLEEVKVLYPPWEIFPAIAQSLKPVLLGEIDPLPIAFDERGLAEKFYADIFSTACRNSFREFIDLLSHENPTMRVLEVGAGTGGMTRHILSSLADCEARDGGTKFSDYTYTDLSPSFFEAAQLRFQEFNDRLQFKIFDLNQKPVDQGFEEGTYDLIIAGCVLHATGDLKSVLQHLRSLLKPNGRLLYLEVVTPENITTNFAFGVLPGWWSSVEDYRALSPTITEQQWDEVLRENGFSGNDLIIRDYKEEACHTFSLMVSTRNALSTVAATMMKRLKVVVRGPSDTKAIDLANTLRLTMQQYESDIVFLDQVSDTIFTDRDVVVSLLEIDAPFLATMRDTDYGVLKLLIQRTSHLIWIAVISLEDPRCPEYSVMQGFLRAIRSENVDKHIVTLGIEISSQQHEVTSYCADYVAKTFTASFESGSDELEYLVSNGQLLTARLAQDEALNTKLRSLVKPQPRSEPWMSGPPVKLTVGTPGFLDQLEFIEDESHSDDLHPHDIEIESKAWGLNFRDVLVALGRVAGDDLGYDCAGVVTRVGSACDTTLQPGDRVCGGSVGCMRTFPCGRATSFVKIPETLSFEAAASLVSPAITACYSLIEVARLSKGEKILIHAAAGATGQMAVQVALMLGAEVFATVGFDEKKQYLVDKYNIQPDHIFYSRDTTFARGIMRVTDGYGVDVVLNSLSGDGLQASWECVAPHGRFIEIGKADITANSTLPMACFARNVTFSAVDLHHISLERPALAYRQLERVMGLLREGMIQNPSPLNIYNLENIEQAFRYLQSGKSMGRIIIGVEKSDLTPKRLLERSDWKLDAHASYVVVGASGGLGRAISKWMVEKEARYLILLSRSGETSTALAEVTKDLRAQGVVIAAPECDVSLKASLSTALEECSKTMPPIKGCIQSAMALHDIIFDNMTYAQWRETTGSKVQASWNLHALLPDGLDFFVLLSSLAGIYGSITQANYSAGCSFQDALARYRTSRGQKAISLDLGWMRNIGIVAETASYQQVRQAANDMAAIEDTELVALLELYCDPDRPILPSAQSQLLVGAVTPADCLSRGLAPPTLALRPMFSGFSMIVGKNGSDRVDGGDGGPSFASLFRQATEAAERGEVVVQGLATKLARAMSIAVDDVEPSKQLSDYGVDSLMAVELRNWIAKDFGVNLAVFEIMGARTIAAIGTLVAEKSEGEKECDS